MWVQRYISLGDVLQQACYYDHYEAASYVVNICKKGNIFMSWDNACYNAGRRGSHDLITMLGTYVGYSHIFRGMCAEGRLDMITFYISRGYEIYRAPLAHYAYSSGKFDVIDYIDTIMSTPWSPAQYSDRVTGACMSGNVELVKMVLQHRYCTAVVLNTAMEYTNDHVDILKVLLEYGVNPLYALRRVWILMHERSIAYLYTLFDHPPPLNMSHIIIDTYGRAFRDGRVEYLKLSMAYIHPEPKLDHYFNYIETIEGCQKIIDAFPQYKVQSILNVIVASAGVRRNTTLLKYLYDCGATEYNAVWYINIVPLINAGIDRTKFRTHQYAHIIAHIGVVDCAYMRLLHDNLGIAASVARAIIPYIGYGCIY
jgi:hypothetical protein